jgi:hypothetical protein
VSDEQQGWFFTFGTGHRLKTGEPLEDRYFVVREPDFGKARLEIWKLRGAVWAMQYPMCDLAGQVADFGLTEISAEELAL